MRVMTRCGIVLVVALAGCASVHTDGGPRKEVVIAATETGELIRFNAARPGHVLARTAISGLERGETLVGIDYRVARGILYGVGSSGRVYRVDAKSGQASAVGPPIAARLEGTQSGLDFNPTVDRMRVVSDTGQNLRLHPDSGALVQADGRLAYAAGDARSGRTPLVSAIAYTYNKTNDKLTTNFAIDCAVGALVTIGTREGVTPAVSPNSGQLFTVGALGTGPCDSASFDIADVDNAALAAIGSRFYALDLDTGKATLLGALPEPVRGIAIEP